MIISHEKKFIILAPWKTASTTLRARLGGYCQSPYNIFYHYNPHIGRIAHQHMTYADLCALPEGKLGYFTAAFVRNPYDRVYSGFRQLHKDLDTQPFSTQYAQPWIKQQVMQQLAANYMQLKMADFNFDAWLALVEEQQIYDATRNSSFPLYPAHYWTHSSGKQAVDFVGRVENFEQNFVELCAKLSIESSSKQNANVDSTAQAGSYKYLSCMNGASISKINALFADDFEIFGYTRY